MAKLVLVSLSLSHTIFPSLDRINKQVSPISRVNELVSRHFLTHPPKSSVPSPPSNRRGGGCEVDAREALFNKRYVDECLRAFTWVELPPFPPPTSCFFGFLVFLSRSLTCASSSSLIMTTCPTFVSVAWVTPAHTPCPSPPCLMQTF